MTPPPISRRGVLAGAAGLGAAGVLGARAQAAGTPKMNVIIFLTDQQRATQDFPAGWEAANLPGLTRLKNSGLSFENAFTNACMCSPARATLMSGYFPAQHGVKYTLEESLTGAQYPQVTLPLPAKLTNIATVMTAAGYNCVYKGKFHLVKPAGSTYVPSDVGQYGFTRWNPQDAGANTAISEAGGGTTNNDGRFMNDAGAVSAGDEGVLAYLNTIAASEQPFCLIVSLVNPHDVLFYPKSYTSAGYDASWLTGTIQPPSTVNESLASKPAVQAEFLNLTNAGLGKIKGLAAQQDYLNFYGNLLKLADGYLVDMLYALDSLNLTDSTLIIRTSDHGEMGLSHGGQRQKNFNFYEQSMMVPLVYSNPQLFPKPVTSSALVSHVDFLPTLATLFDAPASARSAWQGVDYSSIVMNPAAPAVQSYIVFTYDDYQSGQMPPYPSPPNHIVSVREARYKLAEYYDTTGTVASQWEMYDLKADPNEIHNLAAPGYVRNATQQAAYDQLLALLTKVKKTRLKPLA